MEALIVFIGIILILLAAALGTVIGFILQAAKHTPTPKAQPPKELSEQEKRKAERLRREVINMLSYVGDPQEEIHID